MRLLLFFLVWCTVQTLGEVDLNFSKCSEFFYNRSPPKGLTRTEYQPICQRFRNRYHFASLYDRVLRTPLFSAYVISVADGRRPKSTWMKEPQLSFSRADPEMGQFAVPVDQNVLESQAVPDDYRHSNYTKGHLNPSMHMNSSESRKATFTLTNIVPQKAGSNSGTWNILENEVLKRFKSFCEGPMYMITGVLPYASGGRRINNRVGVPEYLWSAYCCPSYRSDLPEFARHLFPTYAALGRNDPSSGEEFVPVNVSAKRAMRHYDVRQMSLTSLEDILAQRLNSPVSLFDGQCLTGPDQ
ncbi:endonuclease domain-containing 1 protein-like [Synchiropus picturatus]